LIIPGNTSGEEVMLDLVMINDKADPPVCKVIDYGKFKYIQEKKKKDNLKKQVKQEIKEVKMSYKIDQHDFDVRMRAVQKFLEDGDRVSLSFEQVTLLYPRDELIFLCTLG
jgi:translation initiation factor IF-3